MREEDDRRKNRSKNIYKRSGRKAVSPTGPLTSTILILPPSPPHTFFTPFSTRNPLFATPSFSPHAYSPLDILSSYPSPHLSSLLTTPKSTPTNTHQSSQLTTPPISNTHTHSP